VTSGQVRYALLSTPAAARGTAAAVRWAHAHARDVSAAAGQPPGTVYRLTAGAATGPATGTGLARPATATGL
jgi:hypothetical protein